MAPRPANGAAANVRAALLPYKAGQLLGRVGCRRLGADPQNYRCPAGASFAAARRCGRGQAAATVAIEVKQRVHSTYVSKAQPR